jgi:hypothetical protein
MPAAFHVPKVRKAGVNRFRPGCAPLWRCPDHKRCAAGKTHPAALFCFCSLIKPDCSVVNSALLRRVHSIPQVRIANNRAW